jgi:molybdopterin-guanine dinucleotide biosynthesis protein MobB
MTISRKPKAYLPVVLSVVGYSGSGKTRLLEKLIPFFKDRGYTVGVIKHSDKPLNEERPGKDTFLFRKAGADGVILAGRDGMQFRNGYGKEFLFSVQRMVQAFFPDHHLVFTEGFKKGGFLKIAVLSPGQERALWEETEGVVIATYGETGPIAECPHFRPEEEEKLAQWLEDRYLTALPFPKIRVLLNGEVLPLNPFVQDLLAGGIRGLLSSLKGFRDSAPVEIHIREGKRDVKP